MRLAASRHDDEIPGFDVLDSPLKWHDKECSLILAT